MTCAHALESSHAIGIADEVIGQDLQCNITPKLQVASAINLAHAAGTNGLHYFIGTESSAGRQAHEMAAIIRGWNGPLCLSRPRCVVEVANL